MEMAGLVLGLRHERGNAKQANVERWRDLGSLDSLYHQGCSSCLVQMFSKNQI